MKMSSLRTLTATLIFGFSMVASFTFAQSAVFNPDDAIVTYNPAQPPTQPASGPGKWVRTSRMPWTTSSFKCYIYKGIAFRLKYPKTFKDVVPGDGKKFPLFLFFHGAGEKGTIYDNEYQLYHGGNKHMLAVDNGSYDGFLLYPQCTNTVFSFSELVIINELIEQYLIPEVRVDPFRISVDGLSGGGKSSWNMMTYFPKLTAGVAPISSSEYSIIPYIKANKFTPIWLFQGALDNEPPVSRTRVLVDSAKAFGANFTYTEFPDRGHDSWYNAWAEPGYFPFLASVHKANPWPLNGRYEFCPGEPVNQVIGVGDGFDEYQWRKNGNIISGATSNTITATTLGTYDCRIRRDTVWSVWSPVPVVLKTKGTTISPDPQLANFASKVLPAPDGSTQVLLKAPDGYASYKWTIAGSNSTLGSNGTYLASAGSYQLTTTENFGCESLPSNPFTVVNANGTNKPEAIRGLIANKLSKTSIKLNWITNANAINLPTNFEIYQATKSGGPYKFVGIVGASERAFTKVELAPGVKYYYIVRPVNNTSAGPVSSEVSAITDVDTQAPTSPVNLRVDGTTRNSIAVSWEAASDDVGVIGYDVYINGVKSYSTTSTSYIIYGLEYNKTYNITVKAKDLAGNESPFSNQASAKTLMKGLSYRYYIGEWDNLPNFNVLTPQSTGFVPNVTLDNRTQTFNFAFLWEGHIRITTPGRYTFRTNSSDGSRVYINKPYDYYATPLVDNDGTHSGQNIQDTMTLAAGVYPIAISYFNKVRTAPTMSLTWRLGTASYTAVPDSVFVEAQGTVTNLPAAPSNLNASTLSYKKIALTWTDNSNNETAFELLRSTDPVNNFATVAVLPANTTSYQDSLLSAATKYYYKVRAINANGESAYDRKGRGVDYSYYETSGLSSAALSVFNSMTPVKTGRTDNFSLGMQSRADNFAVKFEGYINIASAGKYKFYTTSDDGSMLYIDGTLRVNNDGDHSAKEDSSSAFNLSAGQHSIIVTYYEDGGSEVLSASYRTTEAPIISKQIIPATILGQEFVNATTSNAPQAPAAPSGLQTTNVTTTSVKLTWTNNATGVTKFELYRSYGNNEDYVMYAEIPAATTNYTDTALFPSSTVFYKVKAINPNGSSDFSNELNVLTPSTPPVLSAIENQYMRYGTQLKVYINASTTTTEALTLQVTNLPSFAVFNITGNGKGEITFNPGVSQQGVYNNITVSVKNPQNATVTRSFRLTVNENFTPTVTGNTTYLSVNENDTKTLSFTGNDDDLGDVLNWSFSGLPNFIAVNINNRTAVLTVSPISGNAGTYNIIAKVDDSKNGSDTMAFTIEVAPVAISTVYINLSASTDYAVGGIWNSTNTLLSNGTIFPSASTGLTDHNGQSTGIRFSFISGSRYTHYSGVSTGSNSGVYPDKVLKAGYRADWNVTNVMRFTGLDPAKKYSFTFFASFDASITATKYKIGTDSVVLNTTGNTQNVVTINNVIPDANGVALVQITQGPPVGYSGFYYMNAIVISNASPASQTTPPGKVKDLAAKFENNVVKVTWTNTTTNATQYEVYRSNYLSGPFTLLNPGANNGTDESYTDSTIQGNKTYYYFVRGKNSYGYTTSTTIKITIPNRAPVVVTSDVYVKTQQTTNVNIIATDDPSDIITLSASGLPSFATFTDNGSGSGTLHLSPLAGNTGVFSIIVKAKDNYNASTENTVRINVTDKNTTSIYVNFNQEIPVGGIWNSFNKAPAAGASISNLKNDLGVTTSVGVSLVEAWTSGTTGAVTGNNSGAFKDEILQTFYYTDASTRNINISGLSTNSTTRYNLVFMSAVNAFDNRTTIFTAGGKSVSINAAGNTKNTLQINGLAANSSGVIPLTVTKGTGSLSSYINALVIQSYTISETLLAPDNFRALGVAKDSIRLTWNNRADGSSVEIYRSATANGTYEYKGTVSGSSYTDFGGLLKNTEYFYKLKAINGANSSSFSTIASASTYASSVYINFNTEDPAASPWNNTNQNPITGAFYGYFLNDEKIYSGISMTVGDGFSGSNPFGENTGNDIGVVPDNVMRSTWWVDISQGSELKFSGLARNMVYRFTFFASREGTDSRVSTFTINGNKVKLKVSGNRYQTVTIDNVYADQNGEVIVAIRGEGSSGYIGGIIISSAKIPSTPVDGAAGESFRQQNNADATSVVAPENTATSSSAKIYPNPFTSDLMLKLTLKSETQKLNIKVTDPLGRVVFLRELKNLRSGSTVQSLGLDKIRLQAGVYVISIYNDDGYLLPPVKVLKNK